jgi:hypothetical protein
MFHELDNPFQPWTKFGISGCGLSWLCWSITCTEYRIGTNDCCSVVYLLSVTGLKFTQLEKRRRLENKQAPKFWFGMFLSKPRKKKSWIYLSMYVFAHCGVVCWTIHLNEFRTKYFICCINGNKIFDTKVKKLNFWHLYIALFMLINS